MSKDLKKLITEIKCSLYILGVIIFILSCNGQKKMVSKENSVKAEGLTLVAANSYSGADSTETMVITTAKALKLFYSRVNRTRKPGLPVPDVDFTKNMVVVVCSAEENYDNPQKLSIISETDEEMVLGMSKSAESERDKYEMDNMARVSPFFVYKIPLTEKKISFDKVE